RCLSCCRWKPGRTATNLPRSPFMPVALSCPTTEVLKDFVGSCLAEEEARVLSAHLANCPACAVRLETLARADGLLSSLGGGEHPASQAGTPLPVVALMAQLKGLIH